MSHPDGEQRGWQGAPEPAERVNRTGGGPHRAGRRRGRRGDRFVLFLVTLSVATCIACGETHKLINVLLGSRGLLRGLVPVCALVLLSCSSAPDLHGSANAGSRALAHAKPDPTSPCTGTAGDVLCPSLHDFPAYTYLHWEPEDQAKARFLSSVGGGHLNQYAKSSAELESLGVQVCRFDDPVGAADILSRSGFSADDAGKLVGAAEEDFCTAMPPRPQAGT